MAHIRTQTLRIPGTRDQLVYKRTASGRLCHLSCSGTPYLREHDDGRILGGGLATISEVAIAKGVLRHVRTVHESWLETYLLDDRGRPVHIDGVDIRRDDYSRITVCDGASAAWRYAYQGDQLAAIEGPCGLRQIKCGADGRPICTIAGGHIWEVPYDASGHRVDIPSLPKTFHRDELGRLWTISDGHGHIVTTFLWDGFACLGRIDGAPGEPLSAVFSLDPTLTPVRIITHEAVISLPRDAFGESLLVHEHVPGLYGGVNYQGFVHFRSRALDPRLGAFGAPDPWHGGEDDPRREDGYRGPLWVENHRSSAYAICRNDPVAYLDPTGEISVGHLLASLTWAFQNNLLTFVGLEAVVNIFFSLVTGNIDRIVSVQGLSSDRLGVGALNLNPTGPLRRDNVWALQHTVWDDPESFNATADIRVFDPQGEFQPTLYGTLLHAEPEDGDDFLLRGAITTPGGGDLLGWSRAGGKAESIIPGGSVPWFPEGGLHFATREGLRGPKSGTVTELRPSGAMARGKLTSAVLVVELPSINLSGGETVLLRDDEGDQVITTVQKIEQRRGFTTLRLAGDTPEIGPDKVELKTVTGPTPHPPDVLPGINPGAVVVLDNTKGHINGQGLPASAPYRTGDIVHLRHAQDATQQVTQIEGFECRLRLDTAVDPAFGMGFTVWVAQIGLQGTATLGPDADQLNIAPMLPLPAVGDFLRIMDDPGNTQTLQFFVASVDNASRVVRVNGDLTPLLSIGPNARWMSMNRTMQLGDNGQADTDPFINYVSKAIGEVAQAVAAGFVWLENGGNVVVHALAPNAVIHDAFVVADGLEGNPNGNYIVERFAFTTPGTPGHVDVSDLRLQQNRQYQSDISLDTAKAIQFQSLPGSDEATVLSAASAWDRVATGLQIDNTNPDRPVAVGTFNPIRDRPAPSQLVALDNGTDRELALVTQVRLNVPFVRDMALDDAEPIRAVLLQRGDKGPYDATQVTDLRVQVHPTVNGESLAELWLQGGDTLRFEWDDPADPSMRANRESEVRAVDGAVLDLTDSASTGGVDIDSPANNLQVINLDANAGLTYLASRLDSRRIEVTAPPIFGAPPPRFAEGDTLQLSWDDPTNPGNRKQVEFAVSSVVAILLRLTNNSPLPTDASGAPLANNLNVYRLKTERGFTYHAVRQDESHVTLLPFIGRLRVQMPRLRAGQPVMLTFLQTTDLEFAYGIVGEVEGTTFELLGMPSLPDTARGIRVTPLSVADPETGGPWLGINGEPINPIGGSTRRVAFDVWHPDAFPVDVPVMILNGDSAFINVVDSSVLQELEIAFAPPVTIVTNPGVPPVLADIRVPPSASRVGFATTFRLDSDNFWLIEGGLSSINVSDDLVVAILYDDAEDTDGFDRQANGQFHPGSVLVPEDPENWELDRRQSLIDHELRHTQQSIEWGPILLTALPIFLIDVGKAVFDDTDFELPEFSPFVSATLTIKSDEVAALSIADSAAVTFEKGDTVQIAFGEQLQTVTLREGANSNNFRLTDRITLPIANRNDDGMRSADIFVRREQSSPTAWYNIIGNISKPFSAGGAMNLVTALTWGSAYQLIGRLIFLLTRLGNTGKTFPARVKNNGLTLQLDNPGDRQSFLNETHLIVQFFASDNTSEDVGGGNGNTVGGIFPEDLPDVPDKTLVRTIASSGVTDDALIPLIAPVGIPDNAIVKVAAYSTRTPGTYWDWRKYFPATAVPGRPSAIQIASVGDETLTLEPFDRIMMRDDSESTLRGILPFLTKDTVVTAVSGDIVELADEPPFSGSPDTEQILRVAKIGRQDPMGWLDSRLLDEWAGLGWVRWLTDPFAQLHIRTNPEPGSWQDILARSGRYLLGTSAWSGILFIGIFWWDRAYRSDDTAYRSTIEQEASEESGDLYSALGRLRGQIEFGSNSLQGNMVVGDVARYWYFIENSRGSVIPGRRQDRPGVHIERDPRVLPLVTAETAGAPPDEVNRGAEAGSDPGVLLPDVFTLKNTTDPRIATQTNPVSLGASHLGWIPTSPVLERNSGIYVAFTRPGTHRVTVANNIDGAEKARDAQGRERLLSDQPLQKLFFTTDVQDVTVRVNSVNGQQIAESDTLKLLQTQQISFEVEPAGERRYAVTLLRPQNGNLLRSEDDLAVTARTSNGTEAAEISRCYAYNAARDAFEAGGLMQHGGHLPRDVHIPVRLLEIEVVDTLPIVDSLPEMIASDPYAATPAALRSGEGGEVFILIAASVGPFDQQIRYLDTGPANMPESTRPSPMLSDATASASEALEAFLSGGGALRISLAPDDPPEEAAEINFEVDIGVPGNQTTLEAAIQVVPHFRLVLVSGGTHYRVSRGSTLTLRCVDNDGNPVVAGITELRPEQGVSLMTDGDQVDIIVKGDANLGIRELLVDNGSETNHKARRTIEITS